MLLRTKSFAVTLLLLLSWSGCVHYEESSSGNGSTKSQTVNDKATLNTVDHFGNAGGHYDAPRLAGPYAQYPDLNRFIDRMANQHGFSRNYLYGLFSQAQRKQWTLDYLAKEKPAAPPKLGAWARYRAKFLDERHVSSGVAFWIRNSEALNRASKEFGVSPEHIVGIIGVETLYGANLGNHRILDALTTLSFDYPRRATYFQTELEKFLIMCRGEHQDPSLPKGSYAGAMGLGQFMPSSFLEYATDFNGDGRRDLWDAEDAIGSVAKYFAGYGWQTGEPVAIRAEVLDQSRVDTLQVGFDSRHSLEDLAREGIVPKPNPHYPEKVSLLRLSNANGNEYWLGYKNFYVITRYTHSTHYAMAVHQLALAVKKRHGAN